MKTKKSPPQNKLTDEEEHERLKEYGNIVLYVHMTSIWNCYLNGLIAAFFAFLFYLGIEVFHTNYALVFLAPICFFSYRSIFCKSVYNPFISW